MDSILQMDPFESEQSSTDTASAPGQTKPDTLIAEFDLTGAFVGSREAVDQRYKVLKLTEANHPGAGSSMEFTFALNMAYDDNRTDYNDTFDSVEEAFNAAHWVFQCEWDSDLDYWFNHPDGTP